MQNSLRCGMWFNILDNFRISKHGCGDGWFKLIENILAKAVNSVSKV